MIGGQSSPAIARACSRPRLPIKNSRARAEGLQTGAACVGQDAAHQGRERSELALTKQPGSWRVHRSAEPNHLLPTVWGKQWWNNQTCRLREGFSIPAFVLQKSDHDAQINVWIAVVIQPSVWVPLSGDNTQYDQCTWLRK